MKYYITTPELAKGISAIKAQQMGCSGVTAFWWNVTAHPTSGESAIVFLDADCVLNPAVYDEEGVLITPAEAVKVLYTSDTTEITTNNLKDNNYMVSNGWFPA